MRYTDNIQENEILSYEVDIKNGRLILHTQAQDERHVDISFADVYAHDFHNVQPSQNVIRDIETLEFPQFSELFADKIPGWLEYGFPVSAGNAAELERNMKKARINIYAVNAPEGLPGVVFAKGMEILA